mmetsp:Transcript_72736/g.126266  ORF Transcript_72736/g.126266 Transcript_72736/m.126266 type:complete len:606 (-) Transcript_72736:354-2171(-)
MANACSDAAWKDIASQCRDKDPCMSYRQIAAKCGATVPQVKRFLKSKTNQTSSQHHTQLLQPSVELNVPVMRNAQSSINVEGSAARQQGNAFFKEGNFSKALVCYEQAAALNPMCTLSLSNAAEALLRLQQPEKAEHYALRALEIDSNHEKTWGRYVRALSTQHRASEAYVWLAKVFAQALNKTYSESAELDRLQQLRVDLYDVIAKTSACCYHFARGLYIEKEDVSKAGGFCVRTAVKIKSQEPLSKEKAVVPWTCQTIYQDNLLKDFLETVTAEDIQKINGLHPRSYEDMEAPFNHVQSLACLEDRIQTLLKQKRSRATQPVLQVQEYLRALGCAKLCSHDDGLHHFAAFYNHSCAANCEVRGEQNVEIYANRDIEAGEELCISYMGMSGGQMNQLDWPVMLRAAVIRKGWGVKCKCPRCNVEWANDPHAEEYTEVMFMRFQEAALPILNHRSMAFTFLQDNALKKDPLTADWQLVRWKEMYFLSFFERRVNKHIAGSLSSALCAKDGVVSICKDLQKWEVGTRLTRLLDLRKPYVSSGSYTNHFVYHTLWMCLMLHARAGCAWPGFGLKSKRDVKQKMTELEQTIISASGGHMISPFLRLGL